MAHANIVAGYSKMFFEYPAIFLIKAQFQTFKRNVGLKPVLGKTQLVLRGNAELQSV